MTQIELICASCGRHKSLPNRDVHCPDGTWLPLLEWWESRHRFCSSCYRQVRKPGPDVHRHGHDTEYEAALSMRGITGRLRQRVLQLLADNADGLTDDEGAILLGDSDRLRFGRRRYELAQHGLVVDSGRRRPTPHGRSAIVWVLKTRHLTEQLTGS